jgi:pyruvate formate lyase activating enzyme
VQEPFDGIVGWQRSSVLDFPGTVSTVLFFSGCNLRCPYCHNPSLARAELSPQVEPQQILDHLDKRHGIIQGVVLTGGEPTLHANAAALAALLRARGLRVKLDSNGLRPRQIEAIAPDYLAVDVKTDPQRYPALLGAPYEDCQERLKRSIALVRALGERAEVRTTVAPGMVDEGVIEQIGQLIQGVRRCYLQPMQQRVALLDPALQQATPVAMETMRTYRALLARYVGECIIRGDS